MLILTPTSDILQVVTSAAVTTDVTASFVDWNGTTATPGVKNTAITTATTTTVVAAPAAATYRNVKYLCIRNKHASSSQAVIVKSLDNASSVTSEHIKTTLLAGESLVLRDGVWFCYDINGGAKSAGGVTVRPGTCDFRLTGVTGTAVMTADSTSLSTVYLSQFRGNQIALYDGTNWQLLLPSAEPSLAVTGRTTDLPFDVYAYNNAGTVTLEFLDWTNATARATGLTLLDGVYTKTGDATRRYLGSIRARSATTYHWVTVGTDLPCKFDLFNAMNRIDFPFKLIATTNTWNYTTATWRQAQASTNYQLDLMVGLQEEQISAWLLATSTNASTTVSRQVGIGFDTTTALSGLVGAVSNPAAVAGECLSMSTIAHMPVIGRHFYSWNEISTATGTTTWFGDNGALRHQSGMTGLWTC